MTSIRWWLVGLAMSAAWWIGGWIGSLPFDLAFSALTGIGLVVASLGLVAYGVAALMFGRDRGGE
jgi:hypothetical protein